MSESFSQEFKTLAICRDELTPQCRPREQDSRVWGLGVLHVLNPPTRSGRKLCTIPQNDRHDCMPGEATDQGVYLSQREMKIRYQEDQRAALREPRQGRQKPLC